MTQEISHQITKEDLELYKKMGFGEEFGKLRVVGEDNRPNYPSWADITECSSPWAQFLADSHEWFSYLVNTMQERHQSFEFWMAKQRWRKRSDQERLERAQRFEMEVPLGAQKFDPKKFINVFDDLSHSSIIMIGEAISVKEVDPDLVLDIANSKPWGGNGGLQLLADALQRPFIVKAYEELSLEFLPRLK